MPDIFKSLQYKLIKEHYGDQTAKRSGVPFIDQIHEGLMILDFLFVGEYTYAKEAYCLHPLFQSDEELGKTVKRPKGKSRTAGNRNLSPHPLAASG